MYDVIDLQRAIVMAVEAHTGHNDRNNVPYIYHLFYVSAGQDTIEGKILGLLHDSVEDGKLTLLQILQEFDENMRNLVDVMTRRDGESYADYTARVKEFLVTSKVKLKDIEHNTLIDRMDAKAAKKFPMYRDTYVDICAHWNIPNEHFISSTPTV